MLKSKKSIAVLILALLIVIISAIGIKYFGKTEYQKITGGFTSTDVGTIEKYLEDKEDFVLYLGRETCPYCVDVMPILNKSVKKYGINMLYIDTTNTEEREDLKSFRNKHEIIYVPNLMIFKNGDLSFPIIPKTQEEMDKIFE